MNPIEDPAELLNHLQWLHTTELGAMRIRRNLNLTVEDVVAWCQERIQDPAAVISRQGKNWYVLTGNVRITINAQSFTLITAHPIRKPQRA